MTLLCFVQVYKVFPFKWMHSWSLTMMATASMASFNTIQCIRVQVKKEPKGNSFAREPFFQYRKRTLPFPPVCPTSLFFGSSEKRRGLRNPRAGGQDRLRGGSESSRDAIRSTFDASTCWFQFMLLVILGARTLLGTSASLLVTSAQLVVTRS